MRESRSMRLLAFLAAAGSCLGFVSPAFAQDHAGHGEYVPASEPETDHGHSEMDDADPDENICLPVGMLYWAADGSGTSRLPGREGTIGGCGMAASRHMPGGLHLDLGEGWMAMVHGYAWGIYTDQGGPRGDDKLYVQSMAMLVAEKAFEGGRFELRSMLSAEPLMDARGYPSLFATGETADGAPLVDRQHPHDLFMELAAKLDLEIAEDTNAFLYGGPVGEPALGPSAFMHRASAKLNPEAPITHHWFDSTHITYGVVTAGLAGVKWQVEASAFRGREPDENRWDIERPWLDSWSVRATLNPSINWALQASYGRLEEPEALHPGVDEARTTASVHYNSGRLAAMAAFSAKDRLPGPTLTAWLAEATWELAERHTLFGRIENVDNDELFPDHADPLHDRAFRVSKLQAGYAYTLPVGPFELSLGGSVAAFAKPDALDAAYGGNPLGYTLFAKLTLGR